MIAAVLVAAALAAAAQPPDSAGTPAPGARLSPPIPAAHPDPWLGADKLKHFVLAGFTESAAFAVGRAAGLRRRPALAAAVGVAAAVSVGKELADRRRGGRASARDLVWDVAGMLTYGAVLARTER